MNNYIFEIEREGRSLMDAPISNVVRIKIMFKLLIPFFFLI